MPNEKVSQKTEDTTPTFDDLFYMVNDPAGTPASRKVKMLNAAGRIINAQTGTSYTVLTTDFRKFVTHSNGASIAVTLPQASATFPVGWFYYTLNKGAGVVTITPTTSTINGAATLVVNQNEAALIVSDGTNYIAIKMISSVSGGITGTPFELEIACSDESTVLVAATQVATFRMPRGVTLTAVRASLKTAASSGTLTVDINEGGSTILSTKLTIDATEKTSTTAATPVVISDASLADDSEITIDIDDDAAGDAVGLKVTLIGSRV